VLDLAPVQHREAARQNLIAARASTVTVQATATPEGVPSAPDTQRRGMRSLAPWTVAAVGSLAAVLLAAALRRPTN
jgi:hypothetical protein